nr:hypothetical protein [Eubacterium sp.]
MTNNRQFIFRADGNAKIGMGHIMRCLTIADGLSALVDRSNISFICADKESAKVAADRGYNSTAFGTDYRDMNAELTAWNKLELKDSVIIVDSYFINNNYLEGLSVYGKVIILDDMQQETFFADVVFNYNVFADGKTYEKLYEGRDTILCLGAEYVPVRPQFASVDYSALPVVKNVFITTGGGDVDNIAGQLYECMGKAREDLHYHLISGRFNPHFEKLKILEA